MNHYQAMGVVMHKLLRIAYGVLKNRCPYDPAIDQKNRAVARNTRGDAPRRRAQMPLHTQTRRQRFMSGTANEVEEAPLSRRASQKRKQAVSQSSQREECAGSPPALEGTYKNYS